MTRTLSKQERNLCVHAIGVCPSFNLRRSSRAVTRFFDEALEPSGLRSGQLIILMMVATLDNPTFTRLARELVMDSSTIARNVRPLERQGLVKLSAARDKRRKTVSLTDAGVARIREGVPLWRKAHRRFLSQVGDRRWLRLMNDLAPTSGVSHES